MNAGIVGIEQYRMQSASDVLVPSLYLYSYCEVAAVTW